MPTVTNKDGEEKTFSYTDEGRKDAKEFARQGKKVKKLENEKRNKATNELREGPFY
jgi:hypothetical protein